VLFGQMAAQGQSLFTSSGDSGAFGCLLTDDSYTGRRDRQRQRGRQQRAAAAGTIRVRCTLV